MRTRFDLSAPIQVLGWTLVMLLAAFPGNAQEERSSSPTALPLAARTAAEAAPGEVLITFSEFPLRTAIRQQYAAQGIVFGGDAPFIASDFANPTSPVLSGSPTFRGAVEGHFVDPESRQPSVVGSFTLDAGYFDALGSVRLVWLDPEGRRLGQRVSSRRGIETFVITGGNIASFRIEIIETEPAGFAIDNVRFQPSVRSSLLFRESEPGKSAETWSREIPGFDHVGLHVGDRVYESHPGYPTGTYVDATGDERQRIVQQNGVQAQHSRATFRHAATQPGDAATSVIDFEEVPIPEELASRMASHINGAAGSRFQAIDFSFPFGILETLTPAAQKGGDGTFTCVGLVEWSAEQAGHVAGQGFVPNHLESFSLVRVGGVPLVRMPLLSPELLAYSAKLGNLVHGAGQWLQGVFDPVDYMITDPLGRRLGTTAATGTLREIPNAFVTRDGAVEQFLVPNPVPGIYQVELTGLGQPVAGGVDSVNGTAFVDTELAAGQRLGGTVTVESMPSSTGDLDGDADIDNDDRILLAARVGTFAEGLDDPGDIDGDGDLDALDQSLLESLCTRPGCSLEQPVGGCPTGPTSLCLAGGRFHVAVEWLDFAGNQGPGRVVPGGSGGSGMFWFFQRDNWEMLVKVLDGCGVNEHFWVFAAATTNVRYRMTVTDTSTGKVRRYYNRAGDASPAITDTTAFRTCSRRRSAVDDAPLESAPSAVSAPLFAVPLTEMPLTEVPLPPAALARPSEPIEPAMTEAVSAPAAATCPGNPQALCLGGGRFRVETLWRDPSGVQGTGRVVPVGSDDSGLFWFFNPANWEMLVKVLDGCGVNERHWVFAAATTNVEYLLRVTDTRTGTVREYYNPPGRRSPAITDTAAFGGC